MSLTRLINPKTLKNMSKDIENGGAPVAASPAQSTASDTAQTTLNNVSAPATDGAAPATTPTDWREALGEEYRANKSIQSYKSIEDLVKSHIHLEKKLGQKAPSLLGEASKTVYEAEAYKYAAEEGQPTIQPEIFDKVSAKAAALQIAPAQFQELVSEFLGAESQFAEAQKAASATQLKAAEDSLKQEWGTNYEEKLEKAHKGFELFATAELKAEIADLPVSAKANLTRMMAEIYSKIGETSMKKEGNQNNSLTPEQANAKIASIRSDSSHPYHTGDVAAKAEMTQLYLAAAGN